MSNHGTPQGTTNVIRSRRVASENGDRGQVKLHNGLPEGVSEGSEQAYRHPRTGEQRKYRMPLRIDRLPAQVKQAIIAARAGGETWKATAALASSAAGVSLSPSVCQRWYDLRVEQKDSAVPLLRKIISLLEQLLQAVRA